MKKIPSLFVRDWEGDRSRVLDEVDPSCTWVIDGEGYATVKVDGSCRYLDPEGNWWKRYTVKQKAAPAGFVPCGDPDPRTGKVAGWVPVTGGGEDRWFREALCIGGGPNDFRRGQTYELIGPKVQSNPYGLDVHRLVEHGSERADCPHDGYDSIRDWLTTHRHEGVVWHHPDGRMAKIKRRDFGLPWPTPREGARR